MQWRLFLCGIVLLCSSALWSCGDYSVHPEIRTSRTSLTPESIKLLVGIDWQLYSFEEKNLIRVEGNQIFTVSFRETEAVGRADLNLYSVLYEKDSTGHVRFLTVTTTGVPTYAESMDRRFFDALRDAHSFTVSDSVLRIFYESDYALNFRKRPAASLLSFDKLRNSQWRLRSFEEVGRWIGDSTKTTAVPDSQIFTLFMQDSTRFAGRSDCNRYTGALFGKSSADLYNLEFKVNRLYTVPDDNYCPGSMDNTYRSALSLASHYDVTDTSLSIYYDSNRKILHFIADTTTYADGPALESVIGTSWRLTRLFKQRAPLPFSERKTYLLHIAADSLYGQANCKEYSLFYKTYPSSLVTVAPVREVKSGDCEGDTFDEKNFLAHFLAAIKSVQRYTFSDSNTLLLYSPDEGGYRLVFTLK